MSENSIGDVDAEYTAGLDTGEDSVVDLDETFGSDNVDAILDTSYSPPDREPVATRFGTTAEEEREGETLDQRFAQEVPDPNLAFDDPLAATDETEGQDEQSDESIDDGEVGLLRAGRLVDPDEGVRGDLEKDLVGTDVGIDAGAATAEEAAMHIVDDLPGEEYDDLDDELRDA